MKILRFLSDNILFFVTLFLLVFIPLYPKLPILDVVHTWVYIRIEDFIVAFVLLIWIALLIAKKITLKTPLTVPIMLFWIIGAVATIHAVLIIFPAIPETFPNLAFLNFLRRIEYLSLFFIGYVAMREKKFLPFIICTLIITLLLVVGYGFGQKYFEFPAFLTMNEEFAKGEPIRLSAQARVPSTFAGHYDLAAYLVFIIPLLASAVFGIKNIVVRAMLLFTAASGIVLLLMTVSRISVFVLVASFVVLLLLQKKKLLLGAFLVSSIFLVFLSSMFGFSKNLADRFVSTLTEIDVLVNAKTGEAIGNVKEISSSAFANKIIIRQAFENTHSIYGINNDIVDEVKAASTSAIIPIVYVPKKIYFLEEPNAPTGENLPQGTGYINLHMSPVKQKITDFYYQVPARDGKGKSNDIIAFYGNFLVKKAYAYDLSFTTRFQGEWPKTIDAFKRNVFLGSGYSSVSLAVDNNYLRILGEVGILGFIAFFSIFLFAYLYIKKVMPDVDSPLARSFVIGFIAGTFGLLLNAFFIDVFEASKIAFVFWLLTGVVLGMLSLYQKNAIDLYKEYKYMFTSSFAIIIYLLLGTAILYLSSTSQYFTGDDFTWLRWAADCKSIAKDVKACPSLITTIADYFTQSHGFFYRPGTKLYFLSMYSSVWLNQMAYHTVSVILHAIFVVLVFLISKRILRSLLLGAIAAFLFVIISGYLEAVFWISSTGYLFNAVFALCSLYLFILWKEKNRKIYLSFSLFCIVLSLLFHELGTVVPLLIILYDLVIEEHLNIKHLVRKRYYLLLLFPLLPYMFLRFISNSHWFNGDYSYNLLKLPFNFVGNILGYFFLSTLGPLSLPAYQMLRSVSRDNIFLSLIVLSFFAAIVFFMYKKIMKKIASDDTRIIIFGVLFFIIALLPFLGLGNISSRYSYLASFGVIILLTFFIKTMYSFLKESGKHVALMGTIAFILIFSFGHIIQSQKINNDWNVAGIKTKAFLISLSAIYGDDWASDPWKFYFVDVPTREGDAWIFPVGLSDAVWFILRNSNISIYQERFLTTALNNVESVTNAKVFQFENNGSIVEVKRVKQTGQIILYR